MNVTLPTALEQWIESQVRTGEFNDASEVIRAAVRLFRDREAERGQREMGRTSANWTSTMPAVNQAPKTSP